MAYTANRFENMIKEFIIEQQQDAYNKKNMSPQRYNNLKVYMTPAKVKNPHVWIRIGISEACFSLVDSSLISGSVGQDHKYIVKWMNKPGIRDELGETWLAAIKAEFSAQGDND